MALHPLDEYFRQKSLQKTCTCGAQMEYAGSTGTFTCPDCGREEKDLYGRIVALREVNPDLSVAEIAYCLNVPMRELNTCIKDGYLVNPKLEQGDEA